MSGPQEDWWAVEAAADSGRELEQRRAGPARVPTLCSAPQAFRRPNMSMIQSGGQAGLGASP